MNQVRKNFLSNIFMFCVNIVVGLLYTPFLVKMLGTEAYGIVPLALILNQYISILTDSLRGAVTRFYSIEYRQNNFDKASNYLTASVVLSLFLAVVLIPLSWIPISNIDSLLNIPDNYLSSAKALFLLTVISLFLSVVSNCINITIFADNRLDYMNYLKIVRNVLKLLINVIIFLFVAVDIVNIGIAYVLTELIVLLLSIGYYKHCKPRGIHFSFKNFYLKDVRPIFSMITWVSLTSLASVFIYRIDALFINKYFGLYSTGIVGAISEFGSYCLSMTAILSSLLSPLVLIAYSKKNHDDVVRLTIRGGYIIGLYSSLLCGVIMGCSCPILLLWLNEDFAAHYLWMMIKLSSLSLVTMGSIYAYTNHCCNQVKLPALLSVLISLVYILLCVICLEAGMNLTGFLILNFVASISQAMLMSQAVFLKSYPSNLTIVVRKSVKVIIYLSIVTFISWCYCNIVNISNLVVLITSLVLLVLIGFVLAFIFMDREDIDTLDLFIPIKAIMQRVKLDKLK